MNRTGGSPALHWVMTADHLLALLAFCLATSMSPGPNNIMLMASGINFGVRRTLPHATGILVGWPVMLLLVGLGLGQVFTAWPIAFLILKVVSGLYIVWLAWRIATAAPAAEGTEGKGEPMSFLGAAAFQWVNGKAWIMAISSIAAFATTGNYIVSVLMIVAAFALCGVLSSASWTLFGVALRRLLSDPRYFRAINILLAVSLLASLWPMLSH